MNQTQAGPSFQSYTLEEAQKLSPAELATALKTHRAMRAKHEARMFQVQQAVESQKKQLKYFEQEMSKMVSKGCQHSLLAHCQNFLSKGREALPLLEREFQELFRQDVALMAAEKCLVEAQHKQRR